MTRAGFFFAPRPPTSPADRAYCACRLTVFVFNAHRIHPRAPGSSVARILRRTRKRVGPRAARRSPSLLPRLQRHLTPARARTFRSLPRLGLAARIQRRNFLAAREPEAAPEIQRRTRPHSAQSPLPRAARTSKNHEAPLPPCPSTRGHFCRRHGCFPHHNQSSADHYRCRGRRHFAGACAEIIATSPAACLSA